MKTSNSPSSGGTTTGDQARRPASQGYGISQLVCSCRRTLSACCDDVFDEFDESDVLDGNADDVAMPDAKCNFPATTFSPVKQHPMPVAIGMRNYHVPRFAWFLLASRERRLGGEVSLLLLRFGMDAGG